MSNLLLLLICDHILENPADGICAQFVQYAFLVAQVKNCLSSDFVISMSKNLLRAIKDWVQDLHVSNFATQYLCFCTYYEFESKCILKSDVSLI